MCVCFYFYFYFIDKIKLFKPPQRKRLHDFNSIHNISFPGKPLSFAHCRTSRCPLEPLQRTSYRPRNSRWHGPTGERPNAPPRQRRYIPSGSRGGYWPEPIRERPGVQSRQLWSTRRLPTGSRWRANIRGDRSSSAPRPRGTLKVIDPGRTRYYISSALWSTQTLDTSTKNRHASSCINSPRCDAMSAFDSRGLSILKVSFASCEIKYTVTRNPL